MSYEQHVRIQDAQFLAALQSTVSRHEQMFPDAITHLQYLVQKVWEVTR